MKGRKILSKYRGKLLEEHGEVDVEQALRDIEFNIRTKVDAERVNRESKNKYVYVSEKGIPFRGTDYYTERRAGYKVVYLGYKDNEGNQICGSFVRVKGNWKGIYVNTLGNIIKSIRDRYIRRFGSMNSKDIEDVEYYINNAVIEEVENSDNFRNNKFSLYDEVYNRLLIKEKWRATSRNRLSTYIRSLCEKVANEQKKTDSLIGNGYVLSEDREKCLFNTGLIDKFNNDIYLADLSNKESNYYKKTIVIVDSKTFLMKRGFIRDTIVNMPKPIKFYKDKSELIFDGTIDDFDLGDSNRLKHIINERRDRFPAKYKDTPCDVLYNSIETAVSKALQLSERDYKYIVPMYNLTLDKIQYLMPLHLEESIENTPDLVMVVGESNGFYYVYTIISVDDAYDNARLISRPDSNWLNVEEDNRKDAKGNNGGTQSN